MKKIAVIALFTLLAGCATERYYPVQLEGGGHYIAEREYAVASYDSLWAVGVYPWWVHSFYTPYYYPYSFSYFHPFYYPYYGPYHFAGWYPSWPYYSGYPGSYRNEWPLYATQPRHAAGQGAVAPQQRKPGHVAPAPSLRPRQVTDQRKQRATDGRAAFRDDLYRRPSPPQSGGGGPDPRRVSAPIDAARRSQGIAPRPSVAPPVRPAPPTASIRSEPGRVHRTPSERPRSERHE